MLKWIRAAAAAIVVLIAPAIATAQVVVSVRPSAWSGFTDNTQKTAAQMGFFSLVTSTDLTYRTWAGGSAPNTEPTGGQYATYGPSTGYVILPSGSYIRPSDYADGTIFTGAQGATNTYGGIAGVSFDIMFACSDLSTLTQTDGSLIGELSIGLSSRFRHQFLLGNHTSVNYKQRCGVRCLAIPNISTAVPQKINGIDYGSTDEPTIEFNKVYTVTVVVGAGSGTNGWYRIFLDKQLLAQNMGISTTNSDANYGLGATTGNLVQLYSGTATGYSSGSTIEMRVLPRVTVAKGSDWYTQLGMATPASNTGVTRQFGTSFTKSALDSTGYPLTITQVTGTPTAAATVYTATSPNPLRPRFVWTASASDKVRVSSNEPLGNLESESDGDQFVGWVSEYIPTGSAVWGIRTGSDTTSYAIAVNYSNGLLREGSTAGSGTVLFAMDPNKIYGIAIKGNTTTSLAQVYVFNLSDVYGRSSLIQYANLSTAWPKLPMGVQSAEYVFGSTASESSTMIAGRTFGVMAGDSFGSTYTYQRGTATFAITGGSSGVLAVGQTVTDAAGGTLTITAATTSAGAAFTSGTTTCAQAGTITGTLTSSSPFVGAGAITTTGVGTGGGTSGTGTASNVVYNNTLVCERNNIGFHVAYGAASHYFPNAWRPGKPVSTSIPDVVYTWSIGRSGLRVEDMGSTTDACAALSGACVFVPCFAYNSMSGMTASNQATYLSTWGVEARRLRDAALFGGNTVIWPSAPIKVALGNAAAGAYQTTQAESFLFNTYSELAKSVPTTGAFYTYNTFPYSYGCFVGSTDSIHPAGDTEGPRFMISRWFGNPAGGFTTGGLVRK